MLSDAAWRMRSRAAAGEWRRDSIESQEGRRPGQAMIKVIGSGRKSLYGVRRVVEYVERSSAEFQREGRHPLQLLDETGCPAGPGKQALDGWGLDGDLSNLSAQVRRLLADEEFQKKDEEIRRQIIGQMPERDRLHHVQAWHMVVSVSEDVDESRDVTLIRLEEALRNFVYEEFSNNGRPVLWVVHPDGKQPHGHLVVMSKSRFLKNRLRFDKRGEACDSLRESFVRHARHAGLNVTAERRVDREEVRESVLKGESALHVSKRMVDLKRGDRDLAVVAPSWWLKHGAGFEERVAKRAGASDLQGTYVKELSGSIVDADYLGRAFQTLYVDPAQALGAFSELVKSSGALAKWYLRIRPEAFGDVKGHVRPGKAPQIPLDDGGIWLPASDAHLKRALKKFDPSKVLLPALPVRQDASAVDDVLLKRAVRRKSRRMESDRKRIVQLLGRMEALTASKMGDASPRTMRLAEIKGDVAGRVLELPVVPSRLPPKPTLLDRLGTIFRGKEDSRSR